MAKTTTKKTAKKKTAAKKGKKVFSKTPGRKQYVKPIKAQPKSVQKMLERNMARFDEYGDIHRGAIIDERNKTHSDAHSMTEATGTLSGIWTRSKKGADIKRAARELIMKGAKTSSGMKLALAQHLVRYGSDPFSK